MAAPVIVALTDDFVTSVAVFLDAYPQPTRDQIRAALEAAAIEVGYAAPIEDELPL